MTWDDREAQRQAIREQMHLTQMYLTPLGMQGQRGQYQSTGVRCRLPECNKQSIAESPDGYCRIHQQNLDSWRKP